MSVVLASTVGSGLEPSLKTVEQSHQESLESPIFGHGLSRYRRLFWILGASNIEQRYSLVKGEMSCNIHIHRNISACIVCPTACVAMEVRNKDVDALCRLTAVAVPQK